MKVIERYIGVDPAVDWIAALHFSFIPFQLKFSNHLAPLATKVRSLRSFSPLAYLSICSPPSPSHHVCMAKDTQ